MARTTSSLLPLAIDLAASVANWKTVSFVMGINVATSCSYVNTQFVYFITTRDDTYLRRVVSRALATYKRRALKRWYRVAMAMSDCDDCWETPCACGRGYERDRMTLERLRGLVREASRVLAEREASGDPEPVLHPRQQFPASVWQQSIPISAKAHYDLGYPWSPATFRGSR